MLRRHDRPCRGRRAPRQGARRRARRLHALAHPGADPRRPGNARRRDRKRAGPQGQTRASATRWWCRSPSPPSRAPRPSRSASSTRTRPDRHRQAGAARRASGRRACERHARQCADRPLRRQPVGHRRREASRHRASARQGHVGLLVVAKNDAAHQALSEQFAAHGADGRMQRAYLRWSGASRARRAAASRARLERSQRNRTKIAVDQRRSWTPRRDALRGARALRRRDGPGLASLLRLELETGRTHQIRVHLAHIGHPVLGDTTYGSDFKTKAHSWAQKRARGVCSAWPPGAARRRARLRAPGHRDAACASKAPCPPTWQRCFTALRRLAENLASKLR